MGGYVLQGYGLPHSQIAFGAVGDPVSNGKPAGGAFDAVNPSTPREAEAGAMIESPMSLLNLRTSPIAWALALVGVLVYVNGRSRRRGKRRK